MRTPAEVPGFLVPTPDRSDIGHGTSGPSSAFIIYHLSSLYIFYLYSSTIDNNVYHEMVATFLSYRNGVQRPVEMSIYIKMERMALEKSNGTQ